MSVITFVNNIEEETGKTLSAVAIATNMAINYNNKILLLSTSKEDEVMNSCFFDNSKTKKIRTGIFGENKSNLDTAGGIEGIEKIASAAHDLNGIVNNAGMNMYVPIQFITEQKFSSLLNVNTVSPVLLLSKLLPLQKL